MSYITSIGTANPPHKVNQAAIAEFMIVSMGLNDEDARKLRALYRMSGIDSRYSVIGDYGKKNNFDFFRDDSKGCSFPSTQKRMELFQKHSLQLSLDAINDCLSGRPSLEARSFTHLIVVSCTGMYAPGLDIDIVKALRLSTSIQRLSINFMGCYAAFNGLKLADSFCRNQPDARVLLVCTELCSIHFQRQNTQDNVLANALFADGSAAMVIESVPRDGLNFRPESFFCDLATEGATEMAWLVGDAGFEMKLSSYVPEIIRTGIKGLTMSLMSQIKENLEDVSFFAVHPGGKRILEVIEKELGLTRDQNVHAYEVLRQYGNMSSPTVLFVLMSLSKTLTPDDDTKKILSFAFGPGLTLESMLLKIEFH